MLIVVKTKSDCTQTKIYLNSKQKTLFLVYESLFSIASFYFLSLHPNSYSFHFFSLFNSVHFFIHILFLFIHILKKLKLKVESELTTDAFIVTVVRFTLSITKWTRFALVMEIVAFEAHIMEDMIAIKRNYFKVLIEQV